MLKISQLINSKVKLCKIEMICDFTVFNTFFGFPLSKNFCLSPSAFLSPVRNLLNEL